MQVPFTIKPQAVTVSPLYLWPARLKKTILALAVLACTGFYVLLVAGVVSITALGVSILLR